MTFSQADSTSSHARTPWGCPPEKSYDIVILSFCNIVKDQANYSRQQINRWSIGAAMVSNGSLQFKFIRNF